MTDIASVSRSDIEQRRRQLRQQRRWRVVQGMWRTAAIGGIAGSTIWVASLPIWFLQQPDQVVIQGNEVLTAETIQSLLPISYPQSLLRIRPQTIATHLEAQAPIEEATVTRHLFPPGLIVEIQERHPVAVLIDASPDPSIPANAPPTLTNDPALAANAGVSLLDEKGFKMSLENYVALNQAAQLPTLKVIGMPDQYRAEWAQLYQDIIRSPIAIFEVDWRQPGNLILTTELGIVHFGAYGSQFEEQIRTLDQMRQIPEILEGQPIKSIDLSNPDSPLVETFSNTEVIPQTDDSPI